MHTPDVVSDHLFGYIKSQFTLPDTPHLVEQQVLLSIKVGVLSPQCSCLGENQLRIAHTTLQQLPSVRQSIQNKYYYLVAMLPSVYKTIMFKNEIKRADIMFTFIISVTTNYANNILQFDQELKRTFATALSG